ncbi:MAG: hypothetical protein H8K03_09320 [Nitrospira sp.]
MTPFIPLNRARSYCSKEMNLDVLSETLTFLTENSILPTFREGVEDYILIDDLQAVRSVLRQFPSSGSSVESMKLLDFGPPEAIALDTDTRIELSAEDDAIPPVFYAACRNLLSNYTRKKDECLRPASNLSYFHPTRIVSASEELRNIAQAQQRRANVIDASNASHFANSAYYMGSKRSLKQFLVEAISSCLTEKGVVIDLMCGSGAASNGFSRIWRTYASDAQRFCQVLAVVQGGGYSARKAARLLEKLLPLARQHASKLKEEVSELLGWEDRIFHGDIGQGLLEEYHSFLDTCPTYPLGKPHGIWDPIAKVSERKNAPSLVPYCLFTACFSNVYFGLRQCVEIDSLRNAIASLDDKIDSEWALGALTATLSALGTTYAGHFAQPVFRTSSEITLKRLSKVLERRTHSIIHEFSIRLMNLAEESEKSPRLIEVVPGPWPSALDHLEKVLSAEDVLVYLDAPYKREEYSRYYHVLETLVQYDYPSCLGVGKTPNKRTGERFSSDFFTRSGSQAIQAMTKVISEILRRGWKCAWSYSDSGSVNMVKTIESIYSSYECRITSFAVPYEHKSQRGVKPKKVKEYVILFDPQSGRS